MALWRLEQSWFETKINWREDNYEFTSWKYKSQRGDHRKTPFTLLSVTQTPAGPLSSQENVKQSSQFYEGKVNKFTDRSSFAVNRKGVSPVPKFK